MAASNGRPMLDGARDRPDSPWFHVMSGSRWLRPEEVDWVEAAGNYVRLHVGDRWHLLRTTMNSLERQLNAGRFVRIHRSSMVNVDRISHVEHEQGSRAQLVMKNGTRLRLCRGEQAIRRLRGESG